MEGTVLQSVDGGETSCRSEQSGGMTNIVPDWQCVESGALCYLLWQDVQSVQKCENVICVVISRWNIGMTMENPPILWNGSTNGDVTPTLPWDIALWPGR